jgi:prepilin-type processing-associated H-X9-DG protein
VPLLGDGVYYWAIPKHDDPPPANLLAPCATRFPPSYEPINGGLRRFCIARHGRAVNMVFLDGHAETVELTELWRLRWNAQFIPTQVTLPSR